MGIAGNTPPLQAVAPVDSYRASINSGHFSAYPHPNVCQAWIRTSEMLGMILQERPESAKNSHKVYECRRFKLNPSSNMVRASAPKRGV
jgi:hypothetical protein